MSETTTGGNGKADRIRSKISASQARTQGKARPRKAASRPRSRSSNGGNFFDRAIDDHPLAMLAGSVVLGAIAASLLPASWGRKLGSRALGLAAVAGELGALYGGKALSAAAEGARIGQDKLEDLGETLADHSTEAGRKAVELGSLASKRTAELAGAAAQSARETGGGVLKALSDLRSEIGDRVRH